MNQEELSRLRSYGFTELQARIAADVAAKLIADTLAMIEDRVNQLCPDRASQGLAVTLAITGLRQHAEDNRDTLSLLLLASGQMGDKK